MPTVLRKYGYRFHFYSGDGHEPPHVHVDGNGCKAKVWLEDVKIARATGFGDAELRRILSVIKQHQHEMLEAWHDYFA